MSSYKFGQVTVDREQFYEAIDIDKKTLNVDNIAVSDPITMIKKRKRYIIGYKIEGKIVALRIKTPENVYSHGVSKYTETSKLCMSFFFFLHIASLAAHTTLNTYKPMEINIERSPQH